MIDALVEGATLRIGEILAQRDAGGAFVLCHRDDARRADLAVYEDVNAAAEIARFDDGGNYRPLKTAPNLRHGWLLSLASAEEAWRAIDFFYPARRQAYGALVKGELVTTSLRTTLGRQSGIYRVAAKIGDAQMDALVGDFCRSNGGCLRTILWKRDEAGGTPSPRLPPEKFDPAIDQTGRDETVMPLLCQDACNLLVAAAREVVKAGG